MKHSVAIVALTLAVCPAQVLQMERRAYSRLMDLRRELGIAWLACDVEVRKRIAAGLESDAGGNPFVPVARALAAARGVACDAEFLLRSALHCFALPEVLDPAEFPELSVTLHLPYSVPVPAGVRFRIESTSVAGRTRILTEAVEHTAQDDLERFRAVAKIPVGELEGTNALRARILHEGDAAPVGGAVEGVAPVLVLPDFKRRVETLRARRSALHKPVSALDLAVLDGAISAVDRIWFGEPRAGGRDAGMDLAFAEHVLENVDAGRSALMGVRRGSPKAGLERIAIRLPLADGEFWSCEVLLRKGPATPRALVVVVPGTPFWPTHLGAPMSPQATFAGLALDQLTATDLAKREDLQLVVLESPGSIASPATGLAAACAAIRSLLAAKALPLVLVAERDAATVVTMALAQAPNLAQAIVLVDGGSLQEEAVDGLRALPVLGLAARDRASSENLRRAARLAGLRGLATFQLRELALLPRDLALVVAVEESGAWLEKLLARAASRPLSVPATRAK